MGDLKHLAGPMRVPFLILPPACVLLGYATAKWSAGNVSFIQFCLALAGALTAHISVNAFNEYFDFKSGLDFRTRRTPFSGGSGTLPAEPGAASTALATAVTTLAITAAIGLFFLNVRGLGLLPIGMAGLLLVGAYTTWLTRHPFLCLIAPGLGFGPFMVMGTYFALTGEYSSAAFWASLVPFFLVSNLLLLNQFPDVEADREAGRRHLPIVIGRRASSLVYAGFLLATYAVIVVAVVSGTLPRGALLGLGSVALAIPAAIMAYRHAEDIERLVPAMGLNVLVNLSTPILMSLGILIS